MNHMTPEKLRELKRDATIRPYDLAAQLGLPEAALVEADLGHETVRIDPTLGRLIPAITALGEVMALTRNRSCVIEKIGTYNDFHDGEHAAMTLDAEIDMRMFPRHWVHACAVETEGKDGPRRSVQIFDAAGDAIHKVFLRETSNLQAWEALRRDLALPDQQALSTFQPRAGPEGAWIIEEKAATLCEEWVRMFVILRLLDRSHALKKPAFFRDKSITQPNAIRSACASVRPASKVWPNRIS